MEYNIKPYKHSDFNEVGNWWFESTGQYPLPGMMIEDGTFILSINDVKALSITVLLTQSKKMSYLFGFVKNPLFKEISLHEYGQLLWDHCFKYARDKGYTQIICFSDVPQLTEKYQKFGMNKNVENLTSFIKVLE